MDGSNVTGGKGTKSGPRRVRCPKCKELLEEPSDIPLYRCGVCNTTLQAKHYKGPPVHTLYTLNISSGSSSRSNASNDSPERDGSKEKNDPEQNLAGAVDITELKDGVFETGSRHSGSNSDNNDPSKHSDSNSDNKDSNSGEIDRIDNKMEDQEKETVDEGSSDELQRLMISTSGMEHCFSLPASGLEKPSSSGTDSVQMESQHNRSEVDDLAQKSEPLSLEVQTSEKMMDVKYMSCEIPEVDDTSSHFNFELPQQEPNKNGSRGVDISGEKMTSSIILEADEMESTSTARPESISYDAHISKDYVEFDEQMHRAYGEHEILIDQQNLEDFNTNAMNSTKDGLPELNSKSGFISEGSLQVYNICDDQENRNNAIISGDQREEVSDTEVDVLQDRYYMSTSQDSCPPGPINIPNPNAIADAKCEMDGPEDVAVIQSVETISLKGGSESSNSHLLFEERGQEAKMHETKENETQHASSSLSVPDLENASSPNEEEEHAKSGDISAFMEMDTADRNLGNGPIVENKSLPAPTLHKPWLSEPSLETEYDPYRSRRPYPSKTSQSSNGRELQTSNKMGSSNEWTKEVKFHNEKYDLALMSYPSESSPRNARTSFQRNSSDASEGFRYMQQWIESEREELIRSLSMCSDSSERDRERMEILDKIEELRYQLMGSGPLSRMGSRISYKDGKTHRSQPSYGSENEFMRNLPSFSRHSTVRARNYASDRNMIQRSQSPKAGSYGTRYASQQFSPPTPCIHKSCGACCSICSHRSLGEDSKCNLHSMEFQREHVFKKDRDYDLKRYCRPILGAAHFVSCYACFQVLQIPEDFDFPTSSYRQLRCGSCLEILEFSVLGKTQIVPYPRDARESTEMSIPRNVRRGQAAFSEEGDQRSLDGSFCSEIEHVHASGDSDASLKRRNRRKRGNQQPALHKLMGYYSASDIIFQEQD